MPILREALRAATETTVTHEAQYIVDGEIRYFFWATGPDLDAFDSSPDRDPTVTRPEVYAETADRRLYSVTFTEEGHEVATFPTWGEFGLVMLDSQGAHTGWHLGLRIPNREALSSFVDACRERGLSPRIDAIYSEDADDADVDLTSSQREALVAALETGYFEIPRGGSLNDVADRLGISPQRRPNGCGVAWRPSSSARPVRFGRDGRRVGR